MGFNGNVALQVSLPELNAYTESKQDILKYCECLTNIELSEQELLSLIDKKDSFSTVSNFEQLLDLEISLNDLENLFEMLKS